MMKSLRDRLKHILDITENQDEENILIILKTMIAEYESKLDDPSNHKIKQSKNHHWRRLPYSFPKDDKIT